MSARASCRNRLRRLRRSRSIHRQAKQAAALQDVEADVERLRVKAAAKVCTGCKHERIARPSAEAATRV